MLYACRIGRMQFFAVGTLSGPDQSLNLDPTRGQDHDQVIRSSLNLDPNRG